jgi:hypothetical protein
MSLHPSSIGFVAAHLSIGMTEPHHRHSGVVRSRDEARERRQESARSTVLGLHQSSSAYSEIGVKACNQQICAKAVERVFAKLFALRAGVHVDFHPNLHFNDLWCFPGHPSTPVSAGGSPRLRQFTGAALVRLASRASSRRIEWAALTAATT